MPTTDYPSELGIADYFSEDVQGSVLVSIDNLASGRAEQSAPHSSAKILFVLTYRFKSQSITLARVTFLMLHELNPNHLFNNLVYFNYEKIENDEYNKGEVIPPPFCFPVCPAHP